MKNIFVALFFLFSIASNAQKIIAGPMLGHTDFRTAKVWVHFKADLKDAVLSFTEKNNKTNPPIIVNFSTLPGGDFNIATATLTGLEPGKTYNYSITQKNSKEVLATGSVTTQTLWQWRTDPPAFSFITGSCSYINEPRFDRPGKPYGNDSSIFETMAKEKADFMLWLGDNWYTREVDYYSDWGLHYRPAHERAMQVYQPLLKAMPHYAIWDDHDFGWNDADKSYPLKETSREVFKTFWNNPSYGENNQGIYSKFTWNDVDIFLLDDRWFRSNDEMPDSLNGKANENKRMYGKQQMEWLKNALLQSNGNGSVNFRIIATGSQVLNPMSPYDCFRHFSAEYKELMDFLTETKINGIVFLTGDRHHSEVIKSERPNAYALYDITSSPLTSGSHKFGGPEKNNPYRVAGIDNIQNYSKISFSGTRKDRKMKVEFIDTKGNILTDWSIDAKQLR